MSNKTKRVLVSLTNEADAVLSQLAKDAGIQKAVFIEQALWLEPRFIQQAEKMNIERVERDDMRGKWKR